MKSNKFFKCFILSFCGIFILCLSLISSGLANFVFFGNASASINNVKPVGDNIRENQVFSEKGDQNVKTEEYYDVYFTAQAFSVSYTGELGSVNSFDENGNVVVEQYPIVYFDESKKDGDNFEYNFKDYLKGLSVYNQVVDNSEPNFYYKDAYGKWSDGSLGYKKLSNVTEVSMKAINEIGEPITDRLYDASGTKVNFYMWMAMPPKLYTRNGDSSNKEIYSSSLKYKDKIETYHSRWNTFDAQQYVSADGKEKGGEPYKLEGVLQGVHIGGSVPYSPALNKVIEIARFNVPLTIYEEYTVLVNGRKSIIFTPYFSTGIDSRNAGNDRKDRIIIGDNKNGFAEKVMGYEGKFTSDIPSSLKPRNYQLFVYYNFKIEMSDEDRKNKEIPLRVEVLDSKYNWSSTQNAMYLNQNNEYENINLATLPNGVYNIYFITDTINKENEFNNNEIKIIETDFFRNLKGVNIQKSYNLKSFTDSNNKEIKRAYLGIERVYVPQIVGGSTGKFSYSYSDSLPDNKSISFAKRGFNVQNNIDLNNSYLATTISLNSGKQVNQTFSDVKGYEGVTLTMPQTYFGIRLTELTNNYLDSEYNVGLADPKTIGNDYGDVVSNGTDTLSKDDIDSKLNTLDFSNQTTFSEDDKKFLSALGWPYYSYYDESNKKVMEYYKPLDVNTSIATIDDIKNGNITLTQGSATDEDFKNLKQNINKLAIIKIPEGNGIYNIYFRIMYDTDTKMPKYIYFWYYKIANLFINICDNSDPNYAYTLNQSGLSDDLKTNNFVDTSKYKYCSSTYLNMGDNLRLDTKFSLKGNTSNETITLEEILTELEGQGKCLKDSVSGRYITKENLNTNPFIINKNYVFIIEDKPSTANI